MVQIGKKLSALHLPLSVRFADSMCTCEVLPNISHFSGRPLSNSGNLNLFSTVLCIGRNYFFENYSTTFRLANNHTSKREVTDINKKYITKNVAIFRNLNK